jgi:hypothetical protein
MGPPDVKPAASWRQCEDCDKRLYPSKTAARAGTRSVHNKVRIYQCPTNHAGWHATSQSNG